MTTIRAERRRVSGIRTRGVRFAAPPSWAGRFSKLVAHRPDWWAAGAILLLALIFGGGTRQGYWSDAIVQLACLPLIGVTLFRLSRVEINAQGRAAFVLLAGVLLLPVLQLVPLPPTIWTWLPGREAFEAAYQNAGTPLPWLGVSLSPPSTWRAFLALLPPVAVFLSVLVLGRRSRQALTLLLIAFGFFSVFLGLAQLAQGPGSPLRFFAITNPSEAVGFFANRNHFAALLYLILPFTAAWAVGLAADRRPEMLVGVALCLLVFASLLLGLGMARSRAGLVLAMLAGLGGLALAWTGQGPVVTRRGNRFIFLGGLVGAVLILQFALAGILPRLEKGVTEDLRWEFTTVTADIASDFQPLGSGIGTFEAIYRMHEEVDRLRAVYANHAHNDYVELLLEGGWLAVALMVAFVGWLVYMAGRVWRRPELGSTNSLDLSLRRAAMMGVLLLSLHSAVDYPLRTTAVSTVFAFCCAMMVRPFRSQTRRT
jgi:hypothetical protein